MRRTPTIAVAIAALTAALVPGTGLGAEPAAGAPPAAAPTAPSVAAPAASPAPSPTDPVSPAAPTVPATAGTASGGSASGPAPAAEAAAAPAIPAVAPTGVATEQAPAPPTPGDAPAPSVQAATTPSLAAPVTAAPAAAAATPPPVLDGSAATASARSEQPVERKPWRTLPLIGFGIAGGFPDLVHLNILVRPLNWLRLYAGPAWGYVSWGMQGGVVLAPLNWYITPTLSLQAGKLFRSDVSRFVGDDKDAQDVKPLLKKIDYGYYAGDLGLEFGSPRGFNFFLRAGLSFVTIKANGTAKHVDEDGNTVSLRDPKVSAWLPSAKLGFQYWF